MEEINEDRADHGKKPFDGTKATEEKAINESTTDPESGVFHKGEHKKCFAYTAQTGCDKNGYVMDVTVNSGDRKSTRLNSSHQVRSRMPSSA